VVSGREVVEMAEEYLALVREAEVDTLVLGCTHYPMLAGPISYVMGPDVTLVSSAEETALDVYSQLQATEQLRAPPRPPRHAFSRTAFGTGSETFARPSRRFLGATLETTASLPAVLA